MSKWATDKIAELEARVTELLAKCTEVEEDRRMWKSCAFASRSLLEALIAQMLFWRGDDFGAELVASRIEQVAGRNLLLEEEIRRVRRELGELKRKLKRERG